MTLLVNHCERRDATRGAHEPGELILICERQGLNHDTVARYLYRHTHNDGLLSLDFSTAEGLLLGMDKQWDEDDVLHSYYDNVDLTWYQCAHPSCAVMFQRHFVRCAEEGCTKGAHARGLCGTHLERIRYHAASEARERGVKTSVVLDERGYLKTGHPGKASEKEYCSHACAASHGRQKRNGVENGRRLKKYVPGKTCQRGHAKTPENTMVVSNKRGHWTRCRVCHNENEAARRAKAA